MGRSLAERNPGYPTSASGIPEADRGLLPCDDGLVPRGNDHDVDRVIEVFNRTLDQLIGPSIGDVPISPCDVRDLKYVQ